MDAIVQGENLSGIDHVNDLVWSVDRDFRLLSFNGPARNRFELNQGVQARAGLSPDEILPPEQVPLWTTLYNRALQEGPFRVEYEVTANYILEIFFSPILTDGKPTGVKVHGRDITRARIAEFAHREAERKYREIIDRAPEGIYQISTEGRFASVNPAFARILGYDSPEDVLCLTENVLEHAWVDPDERHKWDRQLRQEGEVRGFECRLRRKDGSIIWASLSSRIVPVSSGLNVDREGILEDISARRKRMEELEEREARQQMIFQENGSITLLIDPDLGEIVDANRAAAKYYGYPQEQLVGMKLSQINMLPAKEVKAQQRRAILQEESIFLFPHRLASGEIRDVEVQSSPISIGGKVLLYSFVHDVTDRKRTEMLLRDSEERFRATFEQAAIGMIHTAFDGRILRCNHRYAEILGYSIDELLTKYVQDLTFSEDVPARLAMFERMNSGEADAQRLELRIVRKDGATVWVRTTFSKQRDRHGMPLHFIGFVEDISEQKAAKERLTVVTEAMWASEDRYRTAFQTSLDAISITRARDGLYLDVNSAFMDVTGYTREEVVGRTALELNIWVNLEDRSHFRRTMRMNAACHNLEAQFRKKDGSVIWGLLSTATMEVDGEPCHLAVIRDISEVKAAEERIVAATLALKVSEERYRTAFQTSFDAISISRLCDGTMIDVNEAYLKIYGLKREETIGRTSVEIGIWAHPSDRILFSESLRENPVCRDFEFLFKRSDGETFPALISATEIELDGVRSILSVIRDNSADKAAEERIAAAARALQLSEERYRTAFETSLDSIAIWSLEDGRYVDANAAFLHTFGFEREEVIGRTSDELNVWSEPQDRLELRETLLHESFCRNREVEYQSRDGQRFWGLLSASIIEIDGVLCHLEVIRDISDSRAAEEEIRNLAFYDPLTHLPNRRLLIDRLDLALASSTRTGSKRALLFLDLDDFKMVNDTLGHRIGDLMLVEVGCRMSACVRKSDTVARLGGDEFVAMLDDLGHDPEEAAAKARTVAEKIIAAIRLPYSIEGHEIRTDCSIGVTVFGNEEESTDDVLQQADIAMYEAKVLGHGSLYFFAPALQAAVNARVALESDLRHAVKSGEFRLYYQPQISHGRLIGAEALIRWEHPTRGLLGPLEFIPFAEETGQILQIGNWVLDTACHQIAKWEEKCETAHLCVAVNISARQFREPDFVTMVLETLERTGINPAKLKLELTESAFLESTEEVIAKMSSLRGHGLCFSIDDFGTGYSSLSYLKRLPLEQLKVDSAFVRDILQDETSAAIAQAVISLGKAMGLTVIAEGVETEEQRDFLANLGCHAYQGYLISKPIPVDQFEQLVIGLKGTVSGVRWT